MNLNTKKTNKNSTKETKSMKNILNTFKSVIEKIKSRIQGTYRDEDLDLYEFEQLDAKRGYRPIKNPWENR